MMKQYYPLATLSLWGKFKHLEGGDIMVAAALTKSRPDMRDATFIQYEALADKFAHQRR
ncbi:hypothetical protein SERLA73DRAFT_68377 [Serpula lacrymans var. lacrymans S7.3]|uniref:Uncharacterized protein n=2 Tax=Serpula lacrymans var. lacrymans TaxID=341189 RepID=F8PFD8_SERL3|nr:uncharacterized protein SERLADRAFT_432126 [Serpula lacrymans var. lacrymans S7.9]EGO04707.1 hypothetical protein SERLA73DRAFT_68377 [Serpula lacrymans var. lacrymans S7.3]EGO30553.1 hypothetical protein SERLADRAFT_432126 [Serpula lacrymans var. lacrymans S7.9]